MSVQPSCSHPPHPLAHPPHPLALILTLLLSSSSPSCSHPPHPLPSLSHRELRQLSSMWTREQEQELAELYERFKEEEGKSQPYDRNEIHSCPPPSLLLLLFLLLLKKTFSLIFYGLISMFFLPDSYAVGSLIPRTKGLGTRLLAGNLIPET